MTFSSPVVVLYDVWLVISNLAFLIPAKRAFEYARFTRAPSYFLIVIWSSLYHACRSYGNLCIFSLETHQRLDFFFAELIIPLSALYLIWFPPRYQWVERFLIIVFAILILVLQLYSQGGEMVAQLVVTATSFSLVVAYWIYLKCCTTRRRLPPYNLIYLVRGLVLTGLSVGLFATQGRFMPGYWAIHSVWHVSGALGQDNIIRSRPPADPLKAVDSRIPNSIVRTLPSLR